jgi:5'-nucleotidase
MAGGSTVWTITGTPADCVKFALCQLLDSPPELIVSGINIGVNAGWDVFYSGTVAAAVEGAMNGVPSVAVSTDRGNSDKMDVVAGRAVELILALPREGAAAWNVNIPRLAGESAPPVRLTRQCRSGPPGTCTRQDGPRGRTHYWLGSGEPTDRPGVDTDVGALAAGCISVTPLRTVLTDEEALDGLARHPPFRDPETEDEP